MKLQDWANDNKPDDNLIFKQGYWDQIIFVRDTIPTIFSKSYDEYQKIKESIEVISTHISKSVLLPVFEMVPMLGVRIVMRYNFYDWKISVDSCHEIDHDFMNLFTSKEVVNPIYCEGVPKDKVFGAYADNKFKFTIELGNRYQVFTFFWIMVNNLASQGSVREGPGSK